MYYVLAGIFGILLIAFIGLWQGKCKEIERLREQEREKEEKRRLHDVETQDFIQSEKKRRDLIEIYLVTDAKPAECEQIYAKLIEQGEYLNFFNASTKKKRLNILQKLK